MNYEDRMKSLQWRWTAAHTTIKRYEELLREFRITAIVMFVFMVSSAVYLPGHSGVGGLLLSFSAIMWAGIYAITLGPHITSRLSGKFSFEEELDELRHREDEFEDMAIELEKALYVQRKYYRFVRLSTMLGIYSVLMTAFGFGYLYLI